MAATRGMFAQDTTARTRGSTVKKQMNTSTRRNCNLDSIKKRLAKELQVPLGATVVSLVVTPKSKDSPADSMTFVPWTSSKVSRCTSPTPGLLTPAACPSLKEKLATLKGKVRERLESSTSAIRNLLGKNKVLQDRLGKLGVAQSANVL